MECYCVKSFSNYSSNPSIFICKCCGKLFNGGEIILGNFYCPMCASIIHKNNSDKPRVEVLNTKTLSNGIPKACAHCNNHPSNGGSGICNCILGSKIFY